MKTESLIVAASTEFMCKVRAWMQAGAEESRARTKAMHALMEKQRATSTILRFLKDSERRVIPVEGGFLLAHRTSTTLGDHPEPVGTIEFIPQEETAP